MECLGQYISGSGHAGGGNGSSSIVVAVKSISVS